MHSRLLCDLRLQEEDGVVLVPHDRELPVVALACDPEAAQAKRTHGRRQARPSEKMGTDAGEPDALEMNSISDVAVPVRPPGRPLWCSGSHDMPILIPNDILLQSKRDKEKRYTQLLLLPLLRTSFSKQPFPRKSPPVPS